MICVCIYESTMSKMQGGRFSKFFAPQGAVMHSDAPNMMTSRSSKREQHKGLTSPYPKGVDCGTTMNQQGPNVEQPQYYDSPGEEMHKLTPTSACISELYRS